MTTRYCLQNNFETSRYRLPKTIKSGSETLKKRARGYLVCALNHICVQHTVEYFNAKWFQDEQPVQKKKNKIK